MTYIPDYCDIYFQCFSKSRQLEAEGQYSRAEAAAREALKDTGPPPGIPPNPTLVAQLARCLGAQGRDGEADAAVEQAATALSAWAAASPAVTPRPAYSSIEVW